MKTKFTLVAAIMLSVFFSGNAAVIGINDAKTVALNFFKINAPNTDSRNLLTASLNFTGRETDGTVDFYVFDIKPAPGFVIVSATDNVTPVLGYSTQTNFNSNFAEVGIKSWMGHVTSSVHEAIVQNLPATGSTTTLWSAYRQGINIGRAKSNAVAPLLTTQWNQDPYYNMYCPYDSVNHGRCVTGCAATALAQIMKFWNYPAHGTGVITYADSVSNGFNYNIGTITANLGATYYQYAKMPNQVTGPADDTDVALLMYQCGVAAGMDYGVNTSSAYFTFTGYYNVYTAFVNAFGYDVDSIQYQQAIYHDTATWLPMIKRELNMGRPVFYTGQDTGNLGGHGWICDGYDANNMLHMNWGWGGMDDGYYVTTNLSAAGYNFSKFQTAYVGIQPPPAPTAINNVTATTSFKLFPNPTKNRFTIEGNSGNTVAEYSIYDILGNRISVGQLTGYSNTIEVGNCASGIYFIKLQNPQRETTLRFVVEK